MTTSRSWTLFDMSDVPAAPLLGHPGLMAQPLVPNRDPAGSTLLGLRYEPGAGDNRRWHAVGQVVLVLDGELRVDGRPCGRGAGWFAPGGRTYAVEAGRDG